MAWWLGLSILGVVLVGIITGILISRQVLKAQKKDLSFFNKQVATAGVSAGDSVYQTVGSVDRITTTNQPAKRKPVTHPPENERPKVNLDKRRNSSPARTSLSPALLELQNNLSIATRPLTGNMVNFQTEIWKNKPGEFNAVGTETMAELKEAYVDMMLANNVIWLVNELGRDSQELKDSYAKLANKIAERLQRAMPAVRSSFK